MNELEIFLMHREQHMILEIMYGHSIDEYLQKYDYENLFDSMTEKELKVYELMNEWLTDMRYDNLNFQELKNKMSKMFIEHFQEQFDI